MRLRSTAFCACNITITGVAPRRSALSLPTQHRRCLLHGDTSCSVLAALTRAAARTATACTWRRLKSCSTACTCSTTVICSAAQLPAAITPATPHSSSRSTTQLPSTCNTAPRNFVQSTAANYSIPQHVAVVCNVSSVLVAALFAVSALQPTAATYSIPQLVTVCAASGMPSLLRPLAPCAVPHALLCEASLSALGASSLSSKALPAAALLTIAAAHSSAAVSQASLLFAAPLSAVSARPSLQPSAVLP